MLKISFLNDKTCSPQLYRKAYSIELIDFGLWMKIVKTYYPSTQAAYKTDPTLTDNQTFIYQSEKNKDLFAKSVENKYFSWVPKDPCSKVRTFPENKDPWEPCWCYELV